MRLHLVGIAFVLVLVFAPVTVVCADEEDLTRLPVPEGIDGWDGWYGLYVSGNKSGWAHETIERVGSGPLALWVVRLDAHMEMKVLGQVAEMTFGEMLVFDGSPPYAFRHAVSYEEDGSSRRVIRAVSRADGVTGHIVEGGETRVRRSDPVDYTFSDYATSLAWVRSGPEVGDQVRVRHFSVDDLESDVMTYTVEKQAEEISGGIPIQVFDVAMVSDRQGETGTSRIDGAGKVVGMSMGGLFEMRLESEAVAKQIEVGGDVFLLGAVPVNAALGKAPGVKRLVLEVRGEGVEELADAPRQRILREDGRILLELGDVHENGFPADEEEIARSLAEETEYPIRHPAVVALAKRAVGDATTDREKVAKLVRFVGEHVVDENIPNSLSVMEMLQTPKGDCSEHALLMTALARALFIPAREVSGLMYMGDKHKAFGAHAWTEVLLDGNWVAVDPAWNQLALDATHVTLSHTARDQMRMMRLFGKLTFLLREIERED